MSLPSQLGALEASFLIQLESTQPELAYVFRHVLVRDAVYATLVRRERSRLHQAVGATLESLYADQAESLSLAPQLGAHFAEAGDQPRALKYLTLAADQAAQQYANREAAQYYGQALEIARAQPGVPLAHLYLGRGQALELSGDYAQALAVYEEMEAQAGQRRDEALGLAALAAQVRLHNGFSRVSDPARGRAALEEALQLARDRGNGPAEARLLLYAVRAHVWGRATEQVILAGERAVASARQFGPPELLAEGLIQLANWGYLNEMQLNLARQRLDEAEALLRGLDAPQLSLEQLIARVQALYLSGDFGPASVVLGEIKALSDTMGYGWGLSQYHSFQGALQVEQGAWGAAVAHLEEGIRLGRQYSLGQAELITCAFLSRARAAVGEGAAALAEVRRAHAFLAEHRPFLLAWPLTAEGLLHLAAGDVAAGDVAAASQAIAQARSPDGQRNIITYRLLSKAEPELALAQQDYARVLSLTDEIIGYMRAEGGRLVLCEALANRGRALLEVGQYQDARAALDEAQALAEAMGLRPALWRIAAARAALETRAGNPVAAQSFRGELRRLLVELAEDTGRPDRRAGFLATRDVQAALAL